MSAVELALRCSMLMQKGPTIVIDYMVGRQIFFTILSEARALIRSGALSDDDLVRLADPLEFDASESVSDSLVESIKGEYRLFANTVDELRKSRTLRREAFGDFRKVRWLAGFQFKPNTTKQLVAAYSRNLIDLADLPYSEAKTKFYEKERLIPQGAFTAELRPNREGEVLLAVVSISEWMVFIRLLRFECELSATRLLIASYRFRLQTGNFPAQLSDLVPDFIETVPRDPFDGQDFRYNAACGLLYSVGEDLIDSDGSTDVEKRKGKPQRWQCRDYSYSLTESFRQLVEKSEDGSPAADVDPATP